MVRIRQAALVFAVLALFASSARAAGPIKIVKVDFECSSDDSIGSRLCSAVKEKIRASSGFELVTEKEAENSRRGFGMRMVSESIADYENENIRSAIAIIFTRPVPPSLGFDGYLTSYVLIVGAHAVDDSAETIMADLDKESELVRR